MRWDEELALGVRRGNAPPTLRIYRWDGPAVSLGRRQRLEDLPADFLAGSFPLVRRPTGGGAVFHQATELTYALALKHRPARIAGARHLVPLLHRRLKEDLSFRENISAEDLAIAGSDFRGPFTFCFSAPVCGDLLYQGKKVAGAALRVWSDGLLVQGSIQNLPMEYNRLVRAVSSAVQGAFFHEESIPFGGFDGCRR